jgi:hypothetical protein
MGAHNTSSLHFLCSTYAQKAKNIIFSMQLVTCPNSFRIKGNYQNNVLTIARGIVDIISTTIGIGNVSNAHCYCAFTGLVPPQSPKLELSYLKTEVCGGVSNLVTRPRARMQEWPRGFGEAVHASE